MYYISERGKSLLCSCDYYSIEKHVQGQDLSREMSRIFLEAQTQTCGREGMKCACCSHPPNVLLGCVICVTSVCVRAMSCSSSDVHGPE